MAQQPYPQAGIYPPVSGPPPPYTEVPQPVPQPQPAAPTTQPTAHVEQKKEKKGGFFSNLKKEAEKAGKSLGHELDKAGKSINSAVDRNYQSALMDLFKTGNVVQLVSRVTGRSLQIVINSLGQMVLDANGSLDPSAFNTLWTVTNEGHNQVRLQNYHNYIAIVDGVTVIRSYPPGTPLGLDSKFQLSQAQTQFVTLESLKEPLRHVGFLSNGELKSALTTIKEPASQLGVKLLSSGIPVPVAATVSAHK